MIQVKHRLRSWSPQGGYCRVSALWWQKLCPFVFSWVSGTSSSPLPEDLKSYITGEGLCSDLSSFLRLSCPGLSWMIGVMKPSWALTKWFSLWFCFYSGATRRSLSGVGVGVVVKDLQFNESSEARGCWWREVETHCVLLVEYLYIM